MCFELQYSVSFHGNEKENVSNRPENKGHVTQNGKTFRQRRVYNSFIPQANSTMSALLCVYLFPLFS